MTLNTTPNPPTPIHAYSMSVTGRQINKSRDTDPKAALEGQKPIKMLSKSLLRPLDVSPHLRVLEDELDPIQLHSCLASNINQLQRQVENVGNLIDLKVQRR